MEAMYTGVKVFTATKAKERDLIGEVITRWLRENPRVELTNTVVTQSSDRQFHCLSFTLFFRNGQGR